ncbi:MAG: hypothetical protein IPK88_09510 [Saprospiraceae bacterium]|nr:hypothetical protein [Candidatus Defluviibacterium haderslevense]HQV77518.1 hypothetical protein [Chitinophagales bacterium]HQW79657.1 hypothetical protein [Chitinophagales bacterium]
MNFINPIEILELENTDIAVIDNSIVKKAKRKLFADIDLSDNGHLDYKGLSLTKTDCEKVIDELENTNALEFYSHLVSNKLLNEFLVNGNERLFESFKQESIYKLPEFVKFISPYFSPKFDRAILKAFTDEDVERLRNILRTQVLISTADLNLAFKGLSIEIQNRLQKVDAITKDIKNEESDYSDEDIDEVIDLVKDLFPKELLNQLPPYFQSQINKIAASINFLQLAIWNEFGNSHVALNLLEHLLELNIESVSKPTFQKNYEIVKRKHIDQLEQEKFAPILKVWAETLLNLRTIHTKIEESKMKPKDALGTINSIPIEDLNKLESFADEIRISIAFMLRGISVSMWNVHHDIDTAIKTITKALSINLTSENKTKLNADFSKLKELKKERDEIGEPVSSAPSLSLINGCGTTIYGKTLYFVIIGIPILPIARYNCEETFNGYRFFGKLKLHTWQKVWKYGLIGYVSFLILKALIENN